MTIVKFYILTIFLVYLSYVDIRTRKIPNKIICIILSLSLAFMLFESNPFYYIIGLFLPTTILLIISIIGGHFIGSGDIKISMCLGGLLGTVQTLIIIFLAFIICLFYSIILRLFNKCYTNLPFCPFILISFFIASCLFI